MRIDAEAAVNPSFVSPGMPSLGNESLLSQKVNYVAQVIDDLGVKNALMAGWSRLFSGKMAKGIEVPTEALRHPLSMTTVASDYRNFAEIVHRGVYEFPGAVSAAIDGEPIVDIGGYIGIAAAWFASKYPSSPIHTIEPSERNFSLLTANAQKYNGQIQATHGAVVPESAPLFVSRMGAKPRNFWRHQYSASPPIEGDALEALNPVTPSDILRKLGDRKIGLLKVDIEGAEKALFGSGAADVLLERAGVFVIETHDWLEPGCNDAVQAAAERHGFMALPSHDEHSSLYVKPGLVQDSRDA